MALVLPFPCLTFLSSSALASCGDTGFHRKRMGPRQPDGNVPHPYNRHRPCSDNVMDTLRRFKMLTW